MKKQIRRSVFETNSSSVHSITIALTNSYEDTINSLEDDVIGFHFGEFGWGYEEYDSVDNKASYLWTGIVCSDYFTPEQIKQVKENIKNVLSKHGLSGYFEPYETCSYETSDGGTRVYCRPINYGYVDHAYCLYEWFDELFPNHGEDIDEEMLMRYLFNPESYIQTGNDNSDGEIDSRHSDDNVETVTFWKGN